MKRALAETLRNAGLLPLADRALLLARSLRALPANRRFRAAHPDFAVPPLRLFHEVFNDTHWETYHASGARHARLYARLIREHLRCADRSGRGLDILEWGCGPGRIVRHLSGVLGDHLTSLAGTDVDAASIEWCRAHLGGIRFEVNGRLPPTAFAESSFDVVYSFSIFTHLPPASQLAWAAEMRRLLRPGGLFLTTTQGAWYRPLLPADLRARFDAGEPVVQGGVAEGRKWFFAFQPRAWVQRELLQHFSHVLCIDTPDELGAPHDVWVARR